MKLKLTFCFLLLSMLSCYSQGNWQSTFGLTHNADKDSIWHKPVSFYLSNPKCWSTAKKFYYGKYRPTDEPETEKLLAYVLTEDKDLRPFYRWILDQTINIQDGALGEHTGLPARRYAEKYPSEFFAFIINDNSGNRYRNWVESISYSGFYMEDNYEDPKGVRQNMLTEMIKNCKECDEKTTTWINKFVSDCFVN